MANPYEDWKSPFGGSAGGGLYSGSFGLGGGTATASKPKPPSLDQRLLDQEGALRGKASSIEAEENRRYDASLGTATTAYNDSRNVLSSMIDGSLTFSKAADAIGARSSQTLNAMRSSLGARGLNPNSGVASGMLSRLAFDQGNAVMGAARDTEIENKRRRDVNAAVNFANAMNFANVQNAPVSSVGLDTETNVYEGLLSQKGIQSAAKSQKKASSSNLLGGIIGAGASVLGGLL